VSLLTACQAAARETGLVAAPSSVIGSTDPSAIQLNALAERAAKRLMRFDWQAMTREHSFSTVIGTESYALPSDWARYMSATAWDATNYWPMRGSIGGPIWQAEKRGIVTLADVRKDFRVWQGLVYFIPTPTSVSAIIIEYMRNTPWVNGSTYRATATNDADTTVFPEYLLELELIWRLKRAKNMSFDDERADAEGEISRVLAQDVPATTLDMGVQSWPTPNFVATIPPLVS
jgi:hypothetical protein